jgi:uncharacterized protein DUF3761
MSRTGLTATVLALVACTALPAAAGGPPPGASARCRDGTYSYSRHRSGTCSHHGGVAVWLPPAAAVSTARVAERTVLLAPRTKTDGCRRGAEPDRSCSPGAYNAALTRAVICSGSFRTTTARNVPESEKFAVEREYGLAARPYGRTLEIDHIVSLELGGSNSIANLFPEPGSGTASYHVKDRLENRLHALVCNGSLGLRKAQRELAADWEALYRRVYGVAPGA